MFEITIEETFAAGHALRNYRGKCENVHGHNYRCQVSVEGTTLDEIGLLVDFVELKRIVHAVLDRMDHQWLNEFPPFDALNPSAENMARYIYEEVSAGLQDAGGRQAGVGPSVGNRHRQRHLPSVVGRVLGREFGPLFRKIVERENRRHRADRHAGAAVDAFHGVDVEQRRFREVGFVFLWVDAIDGACVHTGGILGSDARFGDHVSHAVFIPQP